MIPVTKTFLPPLENYVEYLKKIWNSGWVTNNGQFEQELKKQIGDFLEVDNIELVTNGTLAIQLAIKALGLKGEIITTPFTYIATSSAIVWESCKPVFVDIDPVTLCINPELIEKEITRQYEKDLPDIKEIAYFGSGTSPFLCDEKKKVAKWVSPGGFSATAEVCFVAAVLSNGKVLFINPMTKKAK